MIVYKDNDIGVLEYIENTKPILKEVRDFLTTHIGKKVDVEHEKGKFIGKILDFSYSCGNYEIEYFEKTRLANIKLYGDELSVYIECQKQLPKFLFFGKKTIALEKVGYFYIDTVSISLSLDKYNFDDVDNLNKTIEKEISDKIIANINDIFQGKKKENNMNSSIHRIKILN